MPDDTTLSDAARLLSPQLLQDARSDTARGWAARALCVGFDPEAFFPPRDAPATEARAICAACPVRGQCLAYAVTADERFGIWGGLDPRQRHAVRRRLERRGSSASSGSAQVSDAKASAVAVVVARLEYLHLLVIGPIHQPVLVVDPA
jgi:WhiB family transcriptional regulator, redox-sensing transcriptional regulator